MCLFAADPDVLQQGAKALADTRTPLIVAALGLFGTLVPVFLSWIQTRGTDTRRSRQVEDAMKRVAFWQQWLALSTELGDPAADAARQRVHQELDLLCSALSASAAEVHTEALVLRGQQAELRSKLNGLGGFRRLFVLYKPPRPLAWVPRIVFYIFFGIGTLALMVEIPADLGRRSIDGAGVLLTLFIFGIAFAFRTLSIFVEKPRQGTSNKDSVSA